ncbi:transposase, partial [Lactobacillus delbrueckii subsp. bulgaricus]|nr:IS256 family transposase [Lactobacillus delbrueckii subsp. bulgaricus]
EFHQHTLPAYGQHTDTLESTVIQLYSHGVTTREISDLIEKMYSSYYSAGTVPNISKQVETFLSDGFVGIKDMLKQYYPKSKFQRCLVHVMRNIKGKVRVSDRKEALDDFKQEVHKQSSLKEAETVLHASYDKYDSKYSSMIKNLQKIEEDLLVFYQYPKQIRLSIYSTNMIESINNMIKRKTKPKSEFPTEESLDNFLGVQAIGYNDRNAKRTHKGFG